MSERTIVEGDGRSFRMEGCDIIREDESCAGYSAQGEGMMAGRKLVGYLGTCATPYCGSVEGFFCVRCRHYTSYCACRSNYGGCECADRKGWASEGERQQVRQELGIQR